LELSPEDIANLNDEHTAMVLLHVLLTLPSLTLKLTYARVAREAAHVEYLKTKLTDDQEEQIRKKLDYASARLEELRLEMEMEKMHQVEDTLEEYRGDIVMAVREVQKQAAPAIIAKVVKEIQIN
jgi:hypothetical protein